VSDLLSQCGQHFRNIGFGDHVFCWPWRGEINQAAYQKHGALARLARLADQGTPILCQLPIAPPAASGLAAPANMAALVDIQAAPAQWATLSGAGKLARPDMPLAGQWLCAGTVPYLPGLALFAQGADIRAIPWFAMKYDCTGILLPEVLNWPDPSSACGYGVASPPRANASPEALPQTARQWHPAPGAGAWPGGDGQTRLFYPGSMAGADGILPSVRLKRLRRGLEDIAYLWILRQRGRAETASAVINSLVHYGGLEAAGDNYLDPRLDGWAVDPALWELARRLLAQEIVFAVHQHDPDSRLIEAQRVLWRDFDDKTHGMRLEQVRSRVVADPDAKPGEDGQLVAQVWLDLFNEFNHDADVTIALGNLPQGWKPATGTAHLPAMAADTRTTVTLSARVSGIPTSANGKLTLPVTQTVDLRRQQELGAAISFIEAGRLNKPLKIDGLLDDWPLREGNAAGDFALVGRRGRAAGGPAAAPTGGQSREGAPKRPTIAFVLYDDQNLYIGFRCEEPAPAAMVANADNMIHYDQLMACGEDLVEVILDPGAGAKGPEDLYHLVVKSNGVLIAERGVHCDPPLGRSQPWPVAASCAVHKGDKFWSVEMAIPFSDFGPAGDSRLWGVNFTRFATQGCEASSWSGAPRYFYDPKNLGTMFVNRVKKQVARASHP
jgi:hypothetical protein